MKIATLGPKGTFSEQAALEYLKNTKKKGGIVFCSNINEIFNSVNKNKADFGVVPLENLIDGSVGETLDLLYHSDAFIKEEIIVGIHHCIAGREDSGIKDIKTVVSHPKALAQCLGYIRKNNLSTRECLSTADAMRIVAERNQGDLAAIGTESAAKEYGLKILQRNIEDRNNNVTRFIVLSKRKNKKGKGKQYKTSIVLHPTKDRPGLLHDLLKPFAERKINLTKIESRPTKLRLGDYVFYIDFDGHADDRKVRDAFKNIGKLAKIKILGSYLGRY